VFSATVSTTARLICCGWSCVVSRPTIHDSLLRHGIIAPLFFLLLGGAPLAMAYKAVNTLDSMVGYKHSPSAAPGRHLPDIPRRRG
jgi:hypothetical protein